MDQLENDIAHLKTLMENEKGKLIALEKVFHNDQFKEGQLKEVNFGKKFFLLKES